MEGAVTGPLPRSLRRELLAVAAPADVDHHSSRRPRSRRRVLCSLLLADRRAFMLAQLANPTAFPGDRRAPRTAVLPAQFAHVLGGHAPKRLPGATEAACAPRSSSRANDPAKSSTAARRRRAKALPPRGKRLEKPPRPGHGRRRGAGRPGTSSAWTSSSRRSPAARWGEQGPDMAPQAPPKRALRSPQGSASPWARHRHVAPKEMGGNRRSSRVDPGIAACRRSPRVATPLMSRSHLARGDPDGCRRALDVPVGRVTLEPGPGWCSFALRSPRTAPARSARGRAFRSRSQSSTTGAAITLLSTRRRPNSVLGANCAGPNVESGRAAQRSR